MRIRKRLFFGNLSPAPEVDSIRILRRIRRPVWCPIGFDAGGR